MLGYEFEIIDKKVKKNVVANALSRKDEDVGEFHCLIYIMQLDWITEARMNGRITKRCGHSCKMCSKIPIDLIHLYRKMIHYGRNIAYIYVQMPTQTKYYFGIAHLPLKKSLRIFKNLPQGQE